MLKELSRSQLCKLFKDALQWLSKHRKKHPPSSDIWNFRPSWNDQIYTIRIMFARGRCQFDVQKKLTLICGETIDLWSSKDALIIKVLTGIIKKKLKPFLPRTCYHLKGHGGLKGAVRDVIKELPIISWI